MCGCSQSERKRRKREEGRKWKSHSYSEEIHKHYSQGLFFFSPILPCSASLHYSARNTSSERWGSFRDTKVGGSRAEVTLPHGEHRQPEASLGHIKKEEHGLKENRQYRGGGPGVVAHALNSRSKKAETGQSLRSSKPA